MVKITVVPASPVKIKPKFGLFPLTGELVVRAERAGGIARLAEGFVERGGGLDSAGVRRNRRTAEMVAEQVGQRPVRADGETRRAREVIFGHFVRGGVEFEVSASEEDRLAINNEFYALSIAIVHGLRGDLFQARTREIRLYHSPGIGQRLLGVAIHLLLSVVNAS